MPKGQSTEQARQTEIFPYPCFLKGARKERERKMKINSVEAAYFSPTGNGKKIAECVASVLGGCLNAAVGYFDFTLPQNRKEKRVYNKNDIVVLAVPVYAGRVPNKILPDIQRQFSGDGTRAVLLCSYGNRSFGDALTELRDELEKNGFWTVAAAAIVSEHAFAQKLAEGRPNEQDMEEIISFAKQAADKIKTEEDIGYLTVEGNSPAGPYYTPLKEDGTPAVFLKAKPKTHIERCNGCGICVSRCPMGSIDPKDPVLVSGICIKCQACVKYCPQGVKYFDDTDFLSHRAMLLENYTARKENKFFV